MSRARYLAFTVYISTRTPLLRRRPVRWRRWSKKAAAATWTAESSAAPPALAHRGTRLYLSGPDGPIVSQLFSGTAVDARVLSDDPTAASALKMCFAAWTKGTTALLLDIRALAETLGETGALLAEWERSMPELKDRSLSAAQQAVTKGWRWRAEMEEIARTFRDADLPDGFHRAASEIYGALVRDQEAPTAPSTLDAVIESLRHGRLASG